MSKPVAIDPKTTAIVAMDFQRSILGFLPTPEPLLSTVAKAISALRAAGGRVGFVRVAFQDSDFAAFPAHSAMGTRIKAAGAKMHADSPNTAVHELLAPKASDIAVRKIRVGAFSTTDLNTQLKRSGIETLVLAGVHTSGVVLSTVREAHDLDYRVVVLSDACADPEPDVHDFLTTKIFPRQATVMTAAQFAQVLQPANVD